MSATDEARERLLRPMTDEEAATLRLITAADLRAAIATVPPEWPRATMPTALRYL